MKRFFMFLILYLSFIGIVHATTGTVICTNGDTSPLTVRSSVGGSAVGGLSCN